MKKTIKINIGGVLFHVDEDAFLILNTYLDKIKNHFGGEREGNEIITDIETRVAELLQLKLSEQKQVINCKDIDEVISIMGKPEDFSEEDDKEQKSSDIGGNKRFYRNLDNNVVGGVCSGLGAYFKIDPVILRVLFVLLSFPLAGFPAILYLILWIILPPAITTAQKMEMSGDNFTIADIEQRVKSEFENVKSSFQKMKESSGFKKQKRNANNVGSGFVEIINFFGRLFLIIVGVVFIIAGISLVASMFGLFIFSDSFLFWTHTGEHHALIPDFLFSVVHPQSVLLATICIIILILAPITAIIYWGLKLILRFKANDKIISVVGSVAWILSIIILIGLTLFEVKEYAFSTKIDDSIEINLPSTQTLYINSSKPFDTFSEVYFFDEGLEIYTHDEFPNRIYQEPNFRIRYTSGSEISINIETEARGASNRMARKNTESIEFDWHLQDSILYIDPLFYNKNNGRWTFPDVYFVLYLPEGQKICVDKDLKQTLNRAHTVDGIRTSKIPGRCWIMTDDGLDYMSSVEIE